MEQRRPPIDLRISYADLPLKSLQPINNNSWLSGVSASRPYEAIDGAMSMHFTPSSSDTSSADSSEVGVFDINEISPFDTAIPPVGLDLGIGPAFGMGLWPLNQPYRATISPSFVKMFGLTDADLDKLATFQGLDVHLQHILPQLHLSARKVLLAESVYEETVVYIQHQLVRVQILFPDSHLLMIANLLPGAAVTPAGSPPESPAESPETSPVSSPITHNKAERKIKKKRTRRKPTRADDVAGLRRVEGRWKIARPWNAAISTFVLDPEAAAAKARSASEEVPSFLAQPPASKSAATPKGATLS